MNNSHIGCFLYNLVMKSKLLNYSTVIIITVCLLMIYQSFNCDFLMHNNCATLLLIPILFFCFLNIISFVFKLKKETIEVVTLISLVIFFFYLVVIEFCITLGLQFATFSTIKPPISRYNIALRKLKRHEWKGGLTHFPNDLPQNIKNYSFQIEVSYDGYNTHYVKFLADENYIASIKNKYKGKCEILTTKENIKNLDLDIYLDEIKQSDKTCILHKSSSNERYTSGISIYNDNTIYFFYQNF